MIVAIAGQCRSDSDAIVANLATQRVRDGRKVLVIDVGQPGGEHGSQPVPVCAISARTLSRELEDLLPRYQDIVIDAAGRNSAEVRPALLAANLVIVPLHVDEVDLDKQYPLVACLNSARMFNPGLHVLFAIVCGDAGPSASELAAVRAYAAEVMSATLCSAIIRIQADARTGMNDLYRDVFRH
jgi:chromosome partitioning protein